VPELGNKELTGNTLKTYLRSLEYFVKFIAKGLLYKKDMRNARHKEVILRLKERLPDCHGTVHRRTAHQVTTRKVNETFACLTPSNIGQVEASDPAKKAVKLIGFAADKKALMQSKFVTVRDYVIVTTLYENGSRPGPIEKALTTRFKQTTYSASSDQYTINIPSMYRAAKAHQLIQDKIHETTPSAPAKPSPVDETAPGKPGETSLIDKTTTSQPVKTTTGELVKETAASKPAHSCTEGREEVSDSDDDTQVFTLTQVFSEGKME